MSYSRKLRNFIIQPRFQYKITIYFIAGGLALFGGLLAIIFSKLKMVQALLNKSNSLEYSLKVEIFNSMSSILSISAIFFILFCFITFIFAIVISHRIAGPSMAIRAYISELKKGNYDSQRVLRPYDDLKPIMDDLKDLGEHLKSKTNS